VALDAAIVIVLTAMWETLAWTQTGFGDHIHGPRWLTASLPLLVTVPLFWRRSRPLAMWTLVAIGISVQALVSRQSPEGLEMVGVFGIGAYSVARYSTRRGAVIGLGLLVTAAAIYTVEDPNSHNGRVGDQWATAFFLLLWLACWTVGAWIQSRRDSAVNAARAAGLQREAELAVTAERGRVARELHDIVSHNLSVVVLQAAGARAQPGRDTDDLDDTLEKIESSGREALVEMRRMLDVLRADDTDDAGLTPQPGLERLEALVDGVRRAGVPVELAIDGDCSDVSPAVGLSAYRIVQEALTNTLKHAGPARAAVVVRRGAETMTVEVTDDGAGVSAGAAKNGSGHGLVGMRERAALLGGSLHAAPRPEGGFVVRANLPLGEHAS
jgi:signal transduction histidine kinase